MNNILRYSPFPAGFALRPLYFVKNASNKENVP